MVSCSAGGVRSSTSASTISLNRPRQEWMTNHWGGPVYFAGMWSHSLLEGSYTGVIDMHAWRLDGG